MDANIKRTGTEGNERARHEQHTRTADFIERVRVNQQKLTAELKAYYDFIVCGSGPSGSVVARRLAENPDVSVLLLAVEQPRLHFPEPKPNARPSDDKIAALAKVLNQSKKITILGGAGCAGAHTELIELAGKLKAPIVHAMRGKEFIEYDNPFDVGMTGLLGFSSGYRYRQEPHAVRQSLLLDRVFPRQRDRTRPRLSRLRNGRPVVRGEFDVLMRVAAHRSHNLTDAIESLPSGLHRPKHKEHHDILFSDAA